MSVVRTVLGDVEGGGVWYAHEHVVIDACWATGRYPELLLNDLGGIARELREVRGLGVRGMIDTMPGGCGRSVVKLAEVSGASGVLVVAATGVHLAKYYPEGDWRMAAGEEALVEHFVGEIEVGVEGTGHRAGVIKVAGGRDRLSELERRVFRAAGRAQRATGCPIITHCEAGTAALEQVEVLVGAGADLARVTLSHLDRVGDLAYHRRVLGTGVKVEYDSGCRWREAGGENQTVRLMAALLPEFPGQIMAGMDAAKGKYWKALGGGPGLGFLVTTFSEWLRGAGVGEGLIRRVFVENPGEAFTFGPGSPRAASDGVVVGSRDARGTEVGS